MASLLTVSTLINALAGCPDNVPVAVNCDHFYRCNPGPVVLNLVGAHRDQVKKTVTVGELRSIIAPADPHDFLYADGRPVRFCGVDNDGPDSRSMFLHLDSRVG